MTTMTSCSIDIDAYDDLDDDEERSRFEVTTQDSRPRSLN